MFVPLSDAAVAVMENYERRIRGWSRCAGCPGLVGPLGGDHEDFCPVLVRESASRLVSSGRGNPVDEALLASRQFAAAYSDPWCAPACFWRDVADEAAWQLNNKGFVITPGDD